MNMLYTVMSLQTLMVHMLTMTSGCKILISCHCGHQTISAAYNMIQDIDVIL